MIDHLLSQQRLEAGSIVTPIFQMKTLSPSEVKSAAQIQEARKSELVLEFQCFLETLVHWLPTVCPGCSKSTLPTILRLSRQRCIFLISGLNIRFHSISPILYSLPLPPPFTPGTLPIDRSPISPLKWCQLQRHLVKVNAGLINRAKIYLQYNV